MIYPRAGVSQSSASTPFDGADPHDAQRFADEITEALDEEDADSDYTVGDVLRGNHEGGAGPNATQIAGRCADAQAVL